MELVVRTRRLRVDPRTGVVYPSELTIATMDCKIRELNQLLAKDRATITQLQEQLADCEQRLADQQARGDAVRPIPRLKSPSALISDDELNYQNRRTGAMEQNDARFVGNLVPILFPDGLAGLKATLLPKAQCDLIVELLRRRALAEGDSDDEANRRARWPTVRKYLNYKVTHANRKKKPSA